MYIHCSIVLFIDLFQVHVHFHVWFFWDFFQAEIVDWPSYQLHGGAVSIITANFDSFLWLFYTAWTWPEFFLQNLSRMKTVENDENYSTISIVWLPESEGSPLLIKFYGPTKALPV